MYLRDRGESCMSNNSLIASIWISKSNQNLFCALTQNTESQFANMCHLVVIFAIFLVQILTLIVNVAWVLGELIQPEPSRSRKKCGLN